MKTVLGVVGAALLVLAGGVGYLLAADESPSPEAAGLPQGWALCSNEDRGFAIGYPARWYTDELAEYDACEYFDPEPFEVPRHSDFSGAALQIQPWSEPYEEVLGGLAADTRFVRALSREDARVAGRPTVRLEVEATGKGAEDKGVKIAAYVVNRDGAAFVVRTTGFPSKGDYATRQAILDRAIETLVFFTPTAVPLAHGRVLTFGGPVPGGPTAYWRHLQSATDEAPLDTLVSILALPYTRVRGIYVWPFAFDRDPKQLSEEELELLSTFATPREIQGWRRFGGYIGWRTGIQADGDWVFYVAGD